MSEDSFLSGGVYRDLYHLPKAWPRLNLTLERYKPLLENSDLVPFGKFVDFAKSLSPYPDLSPIDSFDQDFVALLATSMIRPVAIDKDGEHLLPKGYFWSQVMCVDHDELQNLIDSPSLFLKVRPGYAASDAAGEETEVERSVDDPQTYAPMKSNTISSHSFWRKLFAREEP